MHERKRNERRENPGQPDDSARAFQWGFGLTIGVIAAGLVLAGCIVSGIVAGVVFWTAGAAGTKEPPPIAARPVVGPTPARKEEPKRPSSPPSSPPAKLPADEMPDLSRVKQIDLLPSRFEVGQVGRFHWRGEGRAWQPYHAIVGDVVDETTMILGMELPVKLFVLENYRTTGLFEKNDIELWGLYWVKGTRRIGRHTLFVVKWIGK